MTTIRLTPVQAGRLIVEALTRAKRIPPGSKCTVEVEGVAGIFGTIPAVLVEWRPPPNVDPAKAEPGDTCTKCKRVIAWESIAGMRVYRTQADGRKVYSVLCGCGRRDFVEPKNNVLPFRRKR